MTTLPKIVAPNSGKFNFQTINAGLVNSVQDENKSIETEQNLLEKDNFSGVMLNKKKIFTHFNANQYKNYCSRSNEKRKDSQFVFSRNDSPTHKQDVSAKPSMKRKNMRDILISKGLNFSKRLSQPNQLQSLIMLRVYKKAKVQLIKKSFINKMIDILKREKTKFFFSQNKLRNIIGDKADPVIASKQNYFGNNNQKNNTYNNQKKFSFKNIICLKYANINNKISQFISNIPVFQPFTQYSILWDLAQLCSLCFFFTFLPLSISFGELLNQNGLLITSILLTVLLISDLLVKLNTGIFFQGKVLTERSEITQHYYQNGMKKDCLSLLPLIIFIAFQIKDPHQSIRLFFSMIYVLFFLRLDKFEHFQRKVEVRFHLSPKISQIINLWNLLFFNLYIIHFLTCLWILVAKLQQNSGVTETWIDKLNITHNQWYIQYLYSFYFNTVTIVTVGYGDIYPQTHIERLYCVFTVLSACGVFAYSISEVGNIFLQMHKFERMIKSNMYIINKYMKQRRISNQLQHKIRHYLEYYWNESEFTSDQKEKEIVNQLSDNLRESLMVEANKIFILESPLLKQNFSLNTLLRTISIAQEQKCTPEEFIYCQGDFCQTLYFIEKGTIEVYIEGQNQTSQKSNKNVLAVLKQGQFFGNPFLNNQSHFNYLSFLYFETLHIIFKQIGYSSKFNIIQCIKQNQLLLILLGEKSFFTGQQRDSTYRSLEFTTLLKIDREQFMQVLKENKEDYEQFCYIRDTMIFNYNSTQYSRKCTLCQNSEMCSNTKHNENGCPSINFIPNKQRLQDSFRIQKENKLRDKKSRSSFKYNSLRNKDIVKKEQDKFDKNYDEFIFNYYMINIQIEINPASQQKMKYMEDLSCSSNEIAEEVDDTISIEDNIQNYSNDSLHLIQSQIRSKRRKTTSTEKILFHSNHQQKRASQFQKINGHRLSGYQPQNTLDSHNKMFKSSAEPSVIKNNSEVYNQDQGFQTELYNEKQNKVKDLFQIQLKKVPSIQEIVIAKGSQNQLSSQKLLQSKSFKLPSIQEIEKQKNSPNNQNLLQKYLKPELQTKQLSKQKSMNQTKNLQGKKKYQSSKYIDENHLRMDELNSPLKLPTKLNMANDVKNQNNSLIIDNFGFNQLEKIIFKQEEFDQMKIYSIYFPHNNYDTIINNLLVSSLKKKEQINSKSRMHSPKSKKQNASMFMSKKDSQIMEKLSLINLNKGKFEIQSDNKLTQAQHLNRQNNDLNFTSLSNQVDNKSQSSKNSSSSRFIMNQINIAQRNSFIFSNLQNDSPDNKQKPFRISANSPFNKNKKNMKSLFQRNNSQESISLQDSPTKNNDNSQLKIFDL